MYGESHVGVIERWRWLWLGWCTYYTEVFSLWSIRVWRPCMEFWGNFREFAANRAWNDAFSFPFPFSWKAKIGLPTRYVWVGVPPLPASHLPLCLVICLPWNSCIIYKKNSLHRCTKPQRHERMRIRHAKSMREWVIPRVAFPQHFPKTIVKVTRALWGCSTGRGGAEGTAALVGLLVS